jgi:hypothetical protein
MRFRNGECGAVDDRIGAGFARGDPAFTAFAAGAFARFAAFSLSGLTGGVGLRRFTTFAALSGFTRAPRQACSGQRGCKAQCGPCFQLDFHFDSFGI